jgi:AraC-like DNA-binding protein
MADFRSQERYSLYELRNWLGINLIGESKVHHAVLEGTVCSYSLEGGLQTSIWNCYIKEDMTLSNDHDGNQNTPYITFAYFADTSLIKLVNCQTQTEYTGLWEYLLFSDSADYLLKIPAGTSVRCFVVNISRKWLCHELNDNKQLQKIRDKVCAIQRLFFMGATTNAEKNSIKRLFEIPIEEELQPFYLKSEVLKIITDLFYDLNDKNTLDIDSASRNLTGVEEYLCSQITGRMPDLKVLAAKFNFSESSLKRRFKEKNGKTMSTYYLEKKMEYARKLMGEKSSLSEVAKLLGYRSTKKFSAMYKRLTLKAE